MLSYTSKSGKPSGVIAFDYGNDYIIVRFPGNTYKYTYDSAGSDDIEIIKALANNLEGLSTYIAQNRPAYEAKY